jgi:hypothetical protein
LAVAPTDDAGYLQLARKVKSEQAQRAPDDLDRVLIGGNLTLVDITRGGVVVRTIGQI